MDGLFVSPDLDEGPGQQSPIEPVRVPRLLPLVLRWLEDGQSGFGVGVGDGVAVGCGVGVAVGAGVGVAVGAGVGGGGGTGVARGVGVAVGAGVGVGVAVGAGVGVAVAAGVGVAVAAGVGVERGVPRGAGVGVAVGAGVGVAVGLGVAVGAGLGVGVGDGVAQFVTVTVTVPVWPFESRSVITVVPSPIATTSNHEAGSRFTVGSERSRAKSAVTVATRTFPELAATIGSPSVTPSMTPVVPRHSESVSELEPPEPPPDVPPPPPTWHSTTRAELDAAEASWS